MLFEVTIMETRKLKIYVEEDYDFQAYAYARELYANKFIKLDEGTIADVTYDVEVLD